MINFLPHTEKSLTGISFVKEWVAIQVRFQPYGWFGKKKASYVEDFYSPCMGKIITKHFISYPARNNWKYVDGSSVVDKDSRLNWWLRWEYEKYETSKRREQYSQKIKETFINNE